MSLGAFFDVYALDEMRMSEGAARQLTAVYWAGLATGRLLAVPLSSRFSPHALLSVDMVGSIACAALLCLVPGAPAGGGVGVGEPPPAPAHGGPPLLWCAAGALGLFMASVFPSVLTHAERAMRVTGRVASCFVVCGALGETLLPLWVALLYPARHAAFPRIVLGASLAQLAAFGWARRAARRCAAQPQDGRR